MSQSQDQRPAQMKWTWWGLATAVICVPLFFLFDHFGKLTIARPAILAVGAIIIAIRVRWDLRKQRWFWMTVILVLLLQSALVFLIPWGDKWVPAFAIVPVCVVDLVIIFLLIQSVEKWMNRPA